LAEIANSFSGFVWRTAWRRNLPASQLPPRRVPDVQNSDGRIQFTANIPQARGGDKHNRLRGHRGLGFEIDYD